MLPGLPSMLMQPDEFPRNGLTHYYKLYANSQDSVGSNNGTDTGMAYGAGYGKFGSGAKFVTASSSHIMLPNQSMSGAGSVSMWVNVQSYASGSGNGLFYLYDGNNNLIRVLGHYANTTGLNGEYEAAGTLEANFAYSPDIADSTWHNLILTWDTTGIVFYKDGSVVGSNSSATLIGAITSTVASIGGNSSFAYYATMYMSDVAQFNRKLTAADVANIWNGGKGTHL